VFLYFALRYFIGITGVDLSKVLGEIKILEWGGWKCGIPDESIHGRFSIIGAHVRLPPQSIRLWLA